MMRRVFKYLLMIEFLFLAGCSNIPGQSSKIANPSATLPAGKTQESNIIMVFAASSLSQPFIEIGKLFEAQHPGTVVNFNFQNANDLALQIGQGAPADVFASAAEKFMTNAINSGRINKEDTQLFARNRLTVIIPKKNPAAIKNLQDLSKPGILLIMGAKEGPQGVYVEQFLSNADNDPRFPQDYKENVYKNIVSYESTVNGVVTKVSLGEADAGFVFYSDSQGSAREKVETLEIPVELNVEANYPIAVLNDSTKPNLAESFIKFVLSRDGQEILTKFGFIPPK
jgi:molybdate transport system substrate-binding protein